MLSVYHLKPKFQQLLLPVLNYLHQRRVTANQLTIVAVLWSGIMGLLLFFSPQHPICLLIVAMGLFIRMALNALDGMMARTFNQQSKKGEVLNEVGDVLSDAFMFCGLFSLSSVNPFILMAFIVLSVINEFAGLLAKVISGTRRYDGPMGKSDRALLLGVWCLVSFVFPVITHWFNSVWLSAILLVLLSTWKRLSNASK